MFSLSLFLHASRAWQPAPVFLPGEFHGQRSLAGYTVHGVTESDSTEQLTHTQGHIINMSLILGHTTWKFSGVRSSVAVELFVGH